MVNDWLHLLKCSCVSRVPWTFNFKQFQTFMSSLNDFRLTGHLYHTFEFNFCIRINNFYAWMNVIDLNPARPVPSYLKLKFHFLSSTFPPTSKKSSSSSKITVGSCAEILWPAL